MAFDMNNRSFCFKINHNTVLKGAEAFRLLKCHTREKKSVFDFFFFETSLQAWQSKTQNPSYTQQITKDAHRKTYYYCCAHARAESVPNRTITRLLKPIIGTYKWDQEKPSNHQSED